MVGRVNVNRGMCEFGWDLKRSAFESESDGMRCGGRIGLESKVPALIHIFYQSETLTTSTSCTNFINFKEVSFLNVYF
jgi:hypothetical protein